MLFETDGGYLLLAFSILLFTGTTISKEENTLEMTDEDRLYEELFIRRHYDRNSRPVRNVNEIIEVQMTMVPVQIAKLDELNEVLKINVWIDMVWNDFRLMWNSSEYDNLTSISVRQSKIWIPDIVLINSVEEWRPFADVNVIVYSDGKCQWYPPLRAESYCPIQISWFPFDEQHCSLEFESWSYDSSKLEMKFMKASVIKSFFRKNSQWDLVDASGNVSLLDYHCCPHPVSHAEFTLHLRRRTLFYWFNLVLPCSLLSFLSSVAFVLPPQSEERIALEISTLLALSVHQLLVADRVPPTSDAIPIMGIYFACIIVMNAASLTVMVVISNLYNRSLSMYPMPNWVKIFICQRLGKLLRMRNTGSKNGRHFEKYENETYKSKNAKNSAVHPKKENIALYDVTSASTKCEIQSDDGNAVNHEEEDDDENEEEVDWQCAALVIDRLCFFVCVSYITIVTTGFVVCVISVQWM